MKEMNPEQVSIKTLLETLEDIFKLSLPYKTRFFSAILLVVVGSAIWLTVPLGLRSLLDAVFEQEKRFVSQKKFRKNPGL